MQELRTMNNTCELCASFYTVPNPDDSPQWSVYLYIQHAELREDAHGRSQRGICAFCELI